MEIHLVFFIYTHFINTFRLKSVLLKHNVVLLLVVISITFPGSSTKKVLGRSYLRAHWARAQGLALRGASRLDDLPLNKKKGGKIEKKWKIN